MTAHHNGPAHIRRIIIVEQEPGDRKHSAFRGIEVAGLAERLWLPGTRADIPAILRALDCFVLPSLAEGTSCTLQEAMACALPIVVTDVGGNAALLKQGELGMLVPSNDPEALANALQETLQVAAHPGAAARAHITQHFALEVVIERYRQLFGGK